MNKSTESWHYIPAGYTMKVRLYLKEESQKSIDKILLGLEKAANITLYELKNHNPMICVSGKKDPSVLFPDFYAMAKASWLNVLREKSKLVANVPASALSAKSGLFIDDMQKAWTMQKKLPIDIWFGKKGKYSVHFYDGKTKKKESFYLRIPAGKFHFDTKEVYIPQQKKTIESEVISVDLPNGLGKAKIKGWYENIVFGDDRVSFAEYYKDSPKSILECRIVKNNIDEYYLTITLSDVYRGFYTPEGGAEETIHGIDPNVKTDSGVVVNREDGSYQKYENKRFHEKVQEQESEYYRQKSRRFGPANPAYRAVTNPIIKKNKSLPYEERQEVPAPSKRYQKADMAQKKLAKKVARRRENYQHYISSREVGNAVKLGMETLDIKEMLKDKRLSYRISDAAFGMQKQKIKYKAIWAGKEFAEADQYYASSHICPDCGYRFMGKEKFGLEVRTFICKKCKAKWDVDEAATENLRMEAEKIFEARGFVESDYDSATKIEDLPVVEYVLEEKAPFVRRDLPVNKEHPEILVHYDPERVKVDKNPYVLLHKDGRIVDDAQGYGYKTVQNAKRAFNYKAKQKKTA